MDKFLPAARFNALAERYDFICEWVGFDTTYRQNIIDALHLPNKKMRVLDVGCGTGTLAVELKKEKANVEVHGVDPDEKILALARKKIAKNKMEVHLNKAYAQKLPFPDRHFDAAYSSLVWHHIPDHAKQDCFDEIFRVLKKGGVFVLSDFGKPKHWWLPSYSHFARFFEEGKANYDGLMPTMMETAGFELITSKPLKNSIELLVGRKP
ncbi:MAG: methyltransferase domain-containing protein [Candidatus Woesearchaeota archaeon]|nr:methyltransferase domain-containing protein [Candidatus Woesearchaeota archaeon]